MATIIMSDAASAMGLDKLAMTATIIYIMQGFVGFPLTNYFLRKRNPSGQGIPGEYTCPGRSGRGPQEGSREKEKLSMTWCLKGLKDILLLREAFDFGAAGFIQWICLRENIFNVSIVMIAAGILAGHYGLIEKEPLKKANSFGILMMALTASFMRYFAQSTPAQVARLIVPVVSFSCAWARVGIMAFSVPVGKNLVILLICPSRSVLNCFLGFPHNFVITNEVVNMLGQTDGEKEHLNKILMSKMIIGSIVSVSSGFGSGGGYACALPGLRQDFCHFRHRLPRNFVRL